MLDLCGWDLPVAHAAGASQEVLLHCQRPSARVPMLSSYCWITRSAPSRTRDQVQSRELPPVCDSQEVSTAIRVGANPVIFLLNNATYVIEEAIHPGAYNHLSNWDYTALATAMSGGSANLFTAKVGKAV